MSRLSHVLPLLAVVSACDPTEGAADITYPDAIAATCDPVDPSVCALPFPSSHFLVADPSSETGVRVAFGETTLPLNRDGVQTAPTYWNERDGYSINSAMMAYLPDVSLEGTIGVRDLEAYADADVKTIVIDVETGERLPHWVELDATAPADIQRLTLLRPAVPMEWNHRYVVGIRGLKTNAGGDLAPTGAFKALRDGTEGNEAVEARRAWYDAMVFPVLEEAGFSRDDLQMAWDFQTASRSNTLGRMELIRDDALAWVDEEGGFTYTLQTEDRDCSAPGEHIARDITGTFTAPLYTLADGPEDPDDFELQAMLTRDENGMPFRNGTTEVEFLARIPCSVADAPVAGSVPVVQYGHGLLGSKGEARGGYLANMADEHGFVIFAQDWTGFMEDDVGGITFMLASNDANKVNPSHFAMISERSMQGMMQKVLGMRMMRTAMVDDPAFIFDDVKVLDPTTSHYYGNSQGAIMGGALVAMSPDIQRGVFGVGGGPYSLLLPRSKDFDPFFLIFKNKFNDHREIMMFVSGLTQQLWDPTESTGWVWDMTRDTDNPKDVLMQVALYDNQVTTIGAEYLARGYGAFQPAPANRPVFNLDEVDVGTGVSGPALVEWLYTDLPLEPDSTIPPGSDEVVEPPFDDGRHLDPHECPRREPAAQEQLWTFLSTGMVTQTCDGACTGEVATTCP